MKSSSKLFMTLEEQMEEVEEMMRGTRDSERQSATSLKVSYRGDEGTLTPEDEVVSAKAWPDGSVTYLLRGGRIVYEKR